MAGEVGSGELDEGAGKEGEGKRVCAAGTRSDVGRAEEGGSLHDAAEGMDELHSIECVFADWVRMMMARRTAHNFPSPRPAHVRQCAVCHG